MFKIDLEGEGKRTDPLYNVIEPIVQVAGPLCCPYYTTFISLAKLITANGFPGMRSNELQNDVKCN